MDYNSDSLSAALVTVVETPEFLDRADKLLTEPEHDELVAYLASNPMAGDLMQGTGGIRKLRWALEGRDRDDLRRLTTALKDTCRRTRR
jgi:hypothetical protein